MIIINAITSKFMVLYYVIIIACFVGEIAAKFPPLAEVGVQAEIKARILFVN